MVSLERLPFRDFTAEEFLGGYVLGLAPKRRRLKCPALVVAGVFCSVLLSPASRSGGDVPGSTDLRSTPHHCEAETRL